MLLKKFAMFLATFAMFLGEIDLTNSLYFYTVRNIYDKIKKNLYAEKNYNILSVYKPICTLVVGKVWFFFS